MRCAGAVARNAETIGQGFDGPDRPAASVVGRLQLGAGNVGLFNFDAFVVRAGADKFHRPMGTLLQNVCLATWRNLLDRESL